MDETTQASQAEHQAPALSTGEQAVKEGDASRERALGAVGRAEENLGHVAAMPVVTATGQVETPGDRRAELAHRELHGGRPSEVSGTPR